MDKKDEEQTTLDLDSAMKDGMDEFQGELEEAASEESDTTKGASETKKEKEETSPAGTKEDKSKKEEPSGKETEHPEEEEKPDKHPEKTEEEKKAELEKEKERKEKEAKARFKSHEEAEDGYRNLQSEKTRVDEENKKLKDQLKKDEEEKKRKADVEKLDGEIEDFAVEAHEKALGAIDELDPDDDSYQKDVAKIWAKKDGDIRRFEREHTVAMPSVTLPTPGVEEETPEEKELKEARDYVNEAAKKAELDPEDEYFTMICKKAPQKDDQGKPMEFKEQVEWAITKTKKYHSKLKAPAADEISKKNQEENLTLDRGGTGKEAEKKEEPAPVSLDDAVENAKEESIL